MWTPIIGTMALLTVRRLWWAVAGGGDEVLAIDLRELAITLGLGAATAKARIAVGRAVQFGLLDIEPDATHVMTYPSVWFPSRNKLDQTATYTWSVT
jgi:hypothetical protein